MVLEEMSLYVLSKIKNVSIINLMIYNIDNGRICFLTHLINVILTNQITMPGWNEYCCGQFAFIVFGLCRATG